MVLQLVLNGFFTGCVYGLVSFGFSLIYGTSRFFNFAHGAIYTCGAYFALLLVKWVDCPLLLAIPSAIVLATILGLFVEVWLYRPLRKGGAPATVLLMASLGLYIVIQNVISLVFGDEVKILGEVSDRKSYEVLEVRITFVQLVVLGMGAVLFAGTGLIFSKGRIGQMLRATTSDVELAKTVGIDTDRLSMIATGVGSSLAAASAILFSLDVDMVPAMGLHVLMVAVVASVIGGVGNVSGAMLGGLFIGLAQNLGVLKLSTQWQDAIVFVILIIFLLFRPQGFLGNPLRKAAV